MLQKWPDTNTAIVTVKNLGQPERVCIRVSHHPKCIGPVIQESELGSKGNKWSQHLGSQCTSLGKIFANYGSSRLSIPFWDFRQLRPIANVSSPYNQISNPNP